MKRIKFLCLFTILFIAATNVKAASCGNYTQEELDYIIKNTAPEDLDLSCSKGTIFSQKYISEIENTLNNLKDFNNKKLENQENIIEPYYYVEYYNQLSVPTYVQERYYYCGPANVKMVLQYINGSSYSQSTYGSNMGTNQNEGTYVYKITNELNKYVPSTKKYSHTIGLTQSSLQALVEQAISNNKPVIANVETIFLDNYQGVSTGHFVTINAYSKNVITDYHFKYVDPNHNSYCSSGACAGMHIEKIDNFYKALAALRDGSINPVTNRYVIY